MTIAGFTDPGFSEKPSQSMSTDVLGVHISAVNVDLAVERALHWIDQSEKHYAAVTGVHGVI